MGAFLFSIAVVALAEMGDKTQLATIALAARYDSLIAVVSGTTLGLMLANIRTISLGEACANRVNMRTMRWVAAGLLVLLGVLALLAEAHVG